MQMTCPLSASHRILNKLPGEFMTGITHGLRLAHLSCCNTTPATYNFSSTLLDMDPAKPHAFWKNTAAALVYK
eukprot:3941499-Heterocapsa_arctica.AAC.1